MKYDKDILALLVGFGGSFLMKFTGISEVCSNEAANYILTLGFPLLCAGFVYLRKLLEGETTLGGWKR